MRAFYRALHEHFERKQFKIEEADWFCSCCAPFSELLSAPLSNINLNIGTKTNGFDAQLQYNMVAKHGRNPK